ncbi:spermatogenesis associated 2-like [Parambassis ranga]|uniref:Spermatogenesis-associated protein 2-like protein n=1 Tax=Parambassis ranga TaxID=210632 RepID=A0A6P7KH31_9TELE|nr:spermatogenesis-associated protein 2-like protein [Parambassis ranga]XP_028286691.1 spermatogenesis-associated protein 2-like protein [Parambassis ranga]
MSSSRQRDMDLVDAYDRSLERQILGQGSSLACTDEDLRQQVEELLMDGDAQEVHCLGLDPLRVMDESLKAAAAVRGRRVQVRGGLRGLAKAFEVLEQAALNLYLGPWRQEYKVIKMHSGTFTHYITPVLSMPQILTVFSLLGYQASSSQPEQLCLDPPRVSPACPDDLLRLACAFFVARCECRLLLEALGKRSGDAQWELSVVRERQRGSSLQVALDNAKKTLIEQLDEEVDLYGDEQINGRQQQQQPQPLVEGDDGSTASPPAVRTHSNGGTSSPSQLEVEVTTRKPDRRPCGESRADQTDSLPGMELSTNPPEAAQSCPCHHASIVCFQRCIQCDSLHDISCASLEACRMNDHNVQFLNSLPVPPSLSSSRMASLSLHDGPKALTSSLNPITYHECCDLTRLDPQVLCFSCGVFHAVSCRDFDLCNRSHNIKKLGLCSCGKRCSRKPLVLCRYCGNEYCNSCWYRNPVSCSCGQTFDQSSSV